MHSIISSHISYKFINVNTQKKVQQKMTPSLLPILAADFRIGSDKVFGCRFQNQQRQSFFCRFLNQQWHILASDF
jgi:hypothetical protein